MPEITIRPAQPADAAAVTELANQHTYQQLSAVERQSGFLTGSFGEVGIAAMLASVPGQVAYAGEELAGFVVNSRLEAVRYPPLVQQILPLLPKLTYQQRPLTDYRWFFYGPVLVRPAYRGQGLLRRLFAASRRALAGHYELGIAFIATDNQTSYALHIEHLGLVEVGRLTWQGNTYGVLVFPVPSEA